MEPVSNPTSASAKTQASYRKRALGLWEMARRKLGTQASIINCVFWHAARAKDKRRRTWDLYRASMRCALQDMLANAGLEQKDVDVALAILRDSKCAPRYAHLEPKTSSNKRKRFTDYDYSLLCNTLSESKSQNAKLILNYLRAGIAAGLRPIEWEAAVAKIENSTYILTVKNAKTSEERSCGEFRRLLWNDDSLSVVYIKDWLLDVESILSGCNLEERQSTWSKFMDNLQKSLNYFTRKIWPKRGTHYALYSARHTFAAAAKIIFSPIEVAALLGHATDRTAFTHYARPPKNKGGMPLIELPKPDPQVVSIIRQTGKIGNLVVKRTAFRP